MGDRANIRFKQSSGHIYFYSHWAGEDLASTFQDAFVKAQSRWNDEAYCTSFCIGQMLKDSLDQLTGHGITVYRTDNERDCLEVDFDAAKVRLRSNEGWHTKDYDWEANAPTLKEWSFSEFATATEIHPCE